MLRKELLKEELEGKNKRFSFKFSDKEYEYFMENARFTELEKKIVRLRREEWTIVAIAIELNMSESGINKSIRKIKNKIIKCIIFG